MKATKFFQAVTFLVILFLGLAVIVHTIQNNIIW